MTPRVSPVPVFSYGSNLDLQDIERWAKEHGHNAPEVVRREVAILEDHELCWNYFSRARQGGAANLGPAPGGRVAGVVNWVYEDTLALLDHKEGHPKRYQREQISVCTERDERVLAWVYLVTKAHIQARFIAPTEAYLDLMIRAGTQAKLPLWHLRDLKTLSEHLKEVR